MTKYEFNDDMEEISGLGGAYEDCCRRMFQAAMEWLDAHPDADPQFASPKDNADACLMGRAALDAAGDYRPSGSQMQAALSSAMWVRTNGWEKYVEGMTHKNGRVGILKDRLKRKTEDYDKLWKRYQELEASHDRRGAIIAEKVLGWKLHPVSGNTQQMVYAPSAAEVGLFLLDIAHSEELIGSPWHDRLERWAYRLAR